jgi:nucleoid-associated protein YgaU
MSAQRTLCPVCNVPLPAQSSICPDCGEDLSPIVYLQQEAALLYNRGLSYAQSGETAQAISLLERSLQVDSSRVQTLTLLAKLYVKQGERLNAAAVWERALEFEPDNQDIRDGLAYLDQLALQEATRVEAEATDNRKRQEEVRRRVRRRSWIGMSLAFFAGVIAFLGVWWLRGEVVKAPAVPLTATLQAEAVAQTKASPTASVTGYASPSPSPTTLPSATTLSAATNLPTPKDTAVPPIAAIAVPSPSATAIATPTPDLVTPVRQVLAGIGPAAGSLEVRQMGGLVLLGGTVPSLFERYRIEHAIRSVPGVSVVDLADVAVVARYRVRSGDTLYGIAKTIYGDGTRWTLLAQANDIHSPYLIFAGEELVVPMP